MFTFQEWSAKHPLIEILLYCKGDYRVTHTVNLSKRLMTVAAFLPEGAFFADIGSDHAYLPCYVCSKDSSAQAIAGEVNQGPYESASETVAAFQLNNQIDIRLGDGLEVLANDQVKQLTIAGMGGSLITDILECGKEYMNSVERIIAQPNIGERNVRKWFLENNFTITHEVIIEENDHMYEILVADKGLEYTPYINDLKEKQLIFGPILLDERPSLFYKKWRIQHKMLAQVIWQMNQATIKNEEKIDRLQRELQWIQEVIDHDRTDN